MLFSEMILNTLIYKDISIQRKTVSFHWLELLQANQCILNYIEIGTTYYILHKVQCLYCGTRN